MTLISCAVICLILAGITVAERIGEGVSQRVNFKTLLQHEGKIGFKDNDKVKKSIKYYYLKRFKENGKNIIFSWNWSASLVPFWALYRKMYITWFVFFIIFSRIGVAIVCHFFPLLPMETVCFYIWILSCLFWGIFGNELYYLSLKHRISNGYHLCKNYSSTDLINPIIFIVGPLIFMGLFKIVNILAKEGIVFSLTPTLQQIAICVLLIVLIVIVAVPLIFLGLFQTVSILAKEDLDLLFVPTLQQATECLYVFYIFCILIALYLDRKKLRESVKPSAYFQNDITSENIAKLI